MASSILNSDDGVISGTSGLKSTGGDDGVLNIQNNGTTAVTVNASGNVGIGTTSPSAALHIAGTSSLSSEFKVGDLTWNSNGNGGVVVQYRGSDDYTELQINNPVSGASVFTVRDGSGSNIAFTQDGAGRFAKTLGVGNATPAASGAGITFPATQSASTNANTLDDYEEGTWTPGFQGAGTAGTYTVTVNSATYTKIGRVVILDADFGFSAASGGTAYAVITGMPFNVGNQALGTVSLQNVNVNDATVNITCQRVSAGTNTRIYFTGTVDNTTGEAIPASSFSTSSTVQITITYTAA